MSLRGIDTGRTGLEASTAHLNVISNNLANLNTGAFKRSTVTFNDIFYQTLRLPGDNVQGEITPLGLQIGYGVKLGSTPPDFTQGNAIITDQWLDVYLAGPGFFRVTDSNGNVFYTRQGDFQPKGDGSGSEGAIHLQTPNGPLILDPPIILPPGPGFAAVSPTGVVTKGVEDVFVDVIDPVTNQVTKKKIGIRNVVIGQIELVRFINPDGLEQIGTSLFVETGASGPEIVGTPATEGFARTVDLTLEDSNVDLAVEMLELIKASQAFNLSAQSVTTGNEEIQTVIALANRTGGGL